RNVFVMRCHPVFLYRVTFYSGRVDATLDSPGEQRQIGLDAILRVIVALEEDAPKVLQTSKVEVGERNERNPVARPLLGLRDPGELRGLGLSLLAARLLAPLENPGPHLVGDPGRRDAVLPAPVG